MRLFLVLVFSLLFTQIFCPSGLAQTAGEVESLIRKSKLVETNRPLRVVTGSSQLAISTYVDKKATDRDCQITALLMMKEIAGKYPKVVSAKVNFFDPATASSYRSMQIERKQVDLLDKGKPVEAVLSGIAVNRGKASFQAIQSQKNSRSATAYNTNTAQGPSPGGYTRFYSSDGSFSVCYPSNWRVERVKDDQVFKCTGDEQDLVICLDLKVPVAERFDLDDQYYFKVYGQYAKVSQANLNISGKEGLIAVRTFVDQGNLCYMHRALFHGASSHPVFTIELFTPGSISAESGRQRLLTILSSFQIQ